jgi:hypothetical protein
MLGEVLDGEPEATGVLHSAYGRLYLQLGSLPLAERHFGSTAAAREELGQDGQRDSLLDSAFFAIGQGQFQAAPERFLQAEAEAGAGGKLNRSEVLGVVLGAPVPASTYFDKALFDTLRLHHRLRPHPIATMTVRQWSRALTEERVTHIPTTAAAPAALLPVWVERQRPDLDWPKIWRHARQRGVPGELADFLFRLLYGPPPDPGPRGCHGRQSGRAG